MLIILIKRSLLIVEYELVDNDTKRLHEVAGEIELIEFVAMIDPELRYAPVDYNFSVHTLQQHGISSIESGV